MAGEQNYEPSQKVQLLLGFIRRDYSEPDCHKKLLKNLVSGAGMSQVKPLDGADNDRGHYFGGIVQNTYPWCCRQWQRWLLNGRNANYLQ